MKLSLKWLSNFIDLKDLSLDQIVNQMIKCGFEVEAIDKIGEGTNLVVGKVIECFDHPDSDHLHVTKVDTKDEILDIVCGAPNCREGIKVIVAKVKAKLKGGEIKSSVIRGVASNGMLCSLKELGVDESLLEKDSTSIDGIEELDDSFEIGETDILKKLGYEDIILDVSIYANRPDCLSMFAMAKECGAILNKKVTLPSYEGVSNIGVKSNLILNSESKNCTHFLAKVVNNVTIKESPKWLKEHLRANGIKTINNLVDISNYVMLETGQPLHFYDLRTNPNKEITVIDTYEGDYEALDEITYKIEKCDLMITSDNKPIGIAGIMGGENTKILDDTSSLIIEAALFDHAQIRRTSNRLGLQTEAAARFSKGLEPLAQNIAMDRAVQLLIELADAKDFEETIEYGKADYSEHKIEESLQHLNALIGKTYTMDEVVDVLKRLDFKYEIKDDTFITSIPSRRYNDLKLPCDIDEEIIRLTDFDSLESTLPKLNQTVGKLSVSQRNKRIIKDILVNNGFNETINYTLVSKKDIDNACMPTNDAYHLLSPLSEARAFMRNSLMNSLLECLRYNLDHYNENLKLFEISKVYAQDIEEERLGIILNGLVIDMPLEKLKLNADFYVLKGLVLNILAKLGFEIGRIQVVENDLDTTHFHPYCSCLVKMNNVEIAILGRLHPNFEKEIKINDVYYAEIILDELNNAKVSKIKAPVISKFPSVSRDISIVLPIDIKASDIIATIKKESSKLIKSVKVFDLYQGEHIADGYKSLSLNIVFEDETKTLKYEDVNPIVLKIIDELAIKYDAKQR